MVINSATLQIFVHMILHNISQCLSLIPFQHRILWLSFGHFPEWKVKTMSFTCYLFSGRCPYIYGLSISVLPWNVCSHLPHKYNLSGVWSVISEQPEHWGTAPISPAGVWSDPAPEHISHVSVVSVQWFFAWSVKASWKSDRKVNCQKTNNALMH